MNQTRSNGISADLEGFNRRSTARGIQRRSIGIPTARARIQFAPHPSDAWGPHAYCYRGNACCIGTLACLTAGSSSWVASSAAELLGLGCQQRTLHAVSAECVRRAPLLLVGPAVFRCARVRPQRPGACLQPLHHGLHPHMLNHLSLLGGVSMTQRRLPW